jgi:predicted TPR repeat methyltransferase
MLSHGNFKQENIAEHYDELSNHYEDIYLMVGYHDPLKCAELTKEIFGENTEDKQIFDMGCGTGLVGQYLKERGFKHVVGVDASKGMLEKAKEKESYSELKELFLGLPDTFPQEYRNRFDAITAAGILAEGHLDNKVFDEMILALKTGGYAIFATRTMYLEQYSYAQGIKKLEDDAKWKLVKEIKFWRYDQAQETVGRFSKVEITGYVY